MNARMLAVLVLLMPAAGVSDAAGQRIDSPYRFVEHSQGAGIYGARVWPSTGRLRLGPHTATGVGVRYGISISGPLTLELDLLYAPTTRSVGDTVLTIPDSLPTIRGEADMNLLLATGSVRFNITGGRTWHGLQPYAQFGAGIATDIAPSSALADSIPANARVEFGTSFAGQLGAGLEWYPSARWSLRVDARNALWKLKYPSAFQTGTGSRLVPADEWEGNSILTAGLSMHF